MTKDQVNRLAMSLGFPYDHSKGEVKDIERLVRLVERVKSEPQNQDVIVVSEKGWRPIFQEFERSVNRRNSNLRRENEN